MSSITYLHQSIGRLCFVRLLLIWLRFAMHFSFFWLECLLQKIEIDLNPHRYFLLQKKEQIVIGCKIIVYIFRLMITFPCIKIKRNNFFFLNWRSAEQLRSPTLLTQMKQWSQNTSEILSLKNQVWWTGFLLGTQAVKVKFKLGKKSSSSNFQNFKLENAKNQVHIDRGPIFLQVTKFE